MTLRLRPITVREALPWARLHHSHLDRPNGGMLAAAVEVCEHPECRCDDNPNVRPYCSCPAPTWRLACVALLDHPARKLMDGFTGNVSRVASDGSTPHAASKCLSAISRMALAAGYLRLVTYTLVGEAGTCCRAAGWWPTAISEGGEWDRPSRRRGGAQQPGEKIRWEFGPRAKPRDLCLCGARAVDHTLAGAACDDYRSVDQYVRDLVGRVELRGRNDNLPLFRGES